MLDYEAMASNYTTPSDSCLYSPNYDANDKQQYAWSKDNSIIVHYLVKDTSIAPKFPLSVHTRYKYTIYMTCNV